MTKTDNKKESPTKSADIVLSYEQRLERFDRRQTRIRVGLLCVLFGTAGFFFWRNSVYEAPTPEPNFAGYYEGPWVNKNGDLIGDGKLVKRAYGVPAAGPNHMSAQARRVVQNPVLSSGPTLEP